MSTPRHLPLLLTLLLVVAFGGAAWLDPAGAALGSSGSEAPGHLWGLWITMEGLLESGPFLRSAAGVGFPGGFTGHLMDPVNLLPFGLGYALGGGGLTGAVLGWNLLHACAILLAGLGARRLAAVVLPQDAPGFLLGELVLVGAIAGGSFLFLHPWLGRTEFLPGVLLPQCLAWLLPGVRTGDRRALLGAGLLLGLMALGGAYLAAFVGLTLLPLGLALLVEGPDRTQRLGRLLGVALVGLLLWSPAGMALTAHPPRGEADVWTPTLMAREPAPWWTVTTLLRWGEPGIVSTSLDPPAYLGLGVLALALVGMVHARRRALPWALLALWLAALALGPTVALPVPGRPWGLHLPVAVLEQVLVPLRHIKSWGRLGILLPVPIGVVAAMGAVALGGWLRPRPMVLAGLMGVVLLVVDQGTWPRPDGLRRPTFDPVLPSALSALLDRLPPGPIIPLPFELPQGRGELLEAGQWQLWRLQHHRPISSTPEAITDVTLRRSYTSQLLATRQLFAAARTGRIAAAVFRRSEAANQRACARRDLAPLQAAGYVAFVLWGPRAGAQSVRDDLTTWFGPPQESEGEGAAWLLAALPTEEGPPCKAPPLHPQVKLVIEVDGSRG